MDESGVSRGNTGAPSRSSALSSRRPPPQPPPAGQQADTQGVSSDVTVLPPSFRQHSILVVEDDEDLQQILRLVLEAEGYQVEGVRTAEEGLRRLRQKRYGLILSDYKLPRRTGAWMLRAATREGVLGQSPALIVTGHPKPRGVERTSIVYKPLEYDSFLSQIRGILTTIPEPGPLGAPRGKAAAAAGAKARVELVLYVSPASDESRAAMQVMGHLLQRYDPAQIDFRVRDPKDAPQEAEADRIVFTPTLVKRRPEPVTWIVGDFHDESVLVDLFRSCGVDVIREK